jgi:CBS-domain-containing membrane protein
MSTATLSKPTRASLDELQARDLMSASLVSLRRTATVREALALLTDRGFAAAPVIDAAGRPIGVVSRTDVLIHEREHIRHADLEEAVDWDTFPAHNRGFSVEVVDPTLVEEIMTPVIFTVTLKAPAREVVKHMLGLKVHQLFVVDDEEVLVGVITALDVLRHL